MRLANISKRLFWQKSTRLGGMIALGALITYQGSLLGSKFVMAIGTLMGVISFARLGHRRSRYALQVLNEGKLLIGITLAIGFAALNTGNNLLYLILGMLLSLIVVSGFLSQQALRKLVANIEFPQHVQAKVPTLARVDLENQKSWTPVFNLEIKIDDCAICTSEPSLLRALDSVANDESFMEITFLRRGLVDLKNLKCRIYTTFPFGLFSKSRALTLSGTLAVYPEQKFPLMLQALSGSQGETNEIERGLELEFGTLKDYAAGDDPRRIAWKRSTLGRQIFVRSPDAEATNELKMHLVRTQQSVVGDPLEERWLASIYATVLLCQSKGQSLTLFVGEHRLVANGNTSSYDAIGRFLAQLDTRTLPTSISREMTREGIILDISSPTMTPVETLP